MYDSSGRGGWGHWGAICVLSMCTRAIEESLSASSPVDADSGGSDYCGGSGAAAAEGAGGGEVSRSGGCEGEESVVVLHVETEEEKAVREAEEAERDKQLQAHVGGVEWTVCWMLLATAVQSARYDARARGALRRCCISHIFYHYVCNLDKVKVELPDVP